LGFTRPIFCFLGTAKQAAEKPAEAAICGGFVTGHDFSRATSAIESIWALEHFRNLCGPDEGSARWLFLGKKATKARASGLQ
jgi:hypothetical protein